MCSECHTPRDMSGNLQTGAYLLGAPVPVAAPPFANIKWALKAPAIAGLDGYSAEQAIRLLMEGITSNGREPSAPMPRFRMNRSDAEAVVAYLKSIK
jgi:mono/diheme cytochrome c family protein